jgi:polysaccharide pyruvyl transferase WcaK-like protein
MGEKNWDVALFTNGSPEDRDFLAAIEPQLKAAVPNGGITVVPPFDRPADLAAFVSGQDLILAHRLHACIAAYSYAIPQLGFAWDIKLNSFLESVGRGEYVANAGIDAPLDCVALAERCLRDPVDPTQLARCIADARADIVELALSLRGEAGDPQSLGDQ